MIKTAESVSLAHPDKVCDQISDAILDACLAQDPHTRAAIETLGGHGIITVCGELTTKAHINIRKIAQDVYRDCGYEENIGVTVNVVEQSPEIRDGVDNDGAGDQGIMVGYACNETPEFLPLEVVLARKLAKAMGKHDGKAQVTIEDGRVIKVLTSVCNLNAKRQKELESAFNKNIKPLIKKGLTVKQAKEVWLQNPNGEWKIGGFNADTGLTGRKLAVDNYGPSIPLGGGAFSGKDATKVDRSAAYMARRIAVDYLKSRKAREVYVHIAYAIGLPDPLMAVVTIDGVQEQIPQAPTSHKAPPGTYNLRPSAIINFLKLRKPQFRESAKYGHFGEGAGWER